MASYTVGTIPWSAFSMHDRNEIFIPNKPEFDANFTISTTSTSSSANWISVKPQYVSKFDFSGPVYKYVKKCGDIFEFELQQDEPAKEKNMKMLWEFYAVNRRTFVHLTKTVVSVYDRDEALNHILLEYADEIKLNVGKPSECVFELSALTSFEPIEDKAD